MQVAQKLSKEYKNRINATDVNILHASGKDAQTTVFHFHLHLLPRFKEDGLNTWPDLKEIKVDRDKLFDKLKSV